MRKLLVLPALLLLPCPAPAACCYFAAKDADVLQPAQKAFITWDPKEKVETFTVQPKFEGNAADFGMVIPTPGRPKLNEMPRDFFKELAVFTTLKKREFPFSPLWDPVRMELIRQMGGWAASAKEIEPRRSRSRNPTVHVLEAGVVGTLDYKVLRAGRADDLYAWLKANKYAYKGDEATLDYYVKRKWYFTAMKIDTMQMKKNKEGSYAGEVLPIRFQFVSDKLIYPLRIAQLSVKDKTEALFYVQTSYKVDLCGDWTYQYHWVFMLWYLQTHYSAPFMDGIPRNGDAWLKAIEGRVDQLVRRGQELGFDFEPGLPPQPNMKGQFATTLEYAKKLTAADIKLLQGKAPYSESVPNPDKGFTAADVKDSKKAETVYKVIRERLAKYQEDRPVGYLVREAPKADVKQLKLLAGHLKEGQFLTKIRKTFTKDEMGEDLLFVPAKLGEAEDWSEYEEVLPTSPP